MFAIRTAKDMIEKSRAELEHYRLNPNPHTIYNLFVT
ncbi:protein of unknown function [Maridesulfovibrio hydrothermalis AM13 = DSM 14728]|uniref:Uncharacterized protein n=1 Tax=Maridesulfovibrio hydrothermalis AM13 = DSM 14728 TaxID=1121451 RepID=L0R7Q2_9BACT|nr:protein of unknown function [Maridesulfovibrio hydrothermalis AM13 = DSM 14728]